MSRRGRFWFVACAGYIVFVALVGCGKSNTHPPGSPQALFDQHCARCHAQAGEPGGPRIGSSKGPNLAHIGSEPGHTATWLADYIRDPTSKRRDAKMPGFADTLKEEEIRALAEYLAGMK